MNLWFEHPVHRVDDVGVLRDIQPDAERPTWQKAVENRRKQAENNRIRKRNIFEIEFSNIEMEGREVSAQELSEKLDSNPRELLSWLGDSKRQKKELKKDFEKYTGEDGKSYIRRKRE